MAYQMLHRRTLDIHVMQYFHFEPKHGLLSLPRHLFSFLRKITENPERRKCRDDGLHKCPLTCTHSPFNIRCSTSALIVCPSGHSCVLRVYAGSHRVTIGRDFEGSEETSCVSPNFLTAKNIAEGHAKFHIRVYTVCPPGGFV